MAETVLNSDPAAIIAALGISSYTDPARIAPHIEDAEFKHLRPFLSADFYAAMLADASAPGTFATPAYQALWNNGGLKIAQAWAVKYEAMLISNVDFGSKGNRVSEDENSRPAEIGLVKFEVNGIFRKIQTKLEMVREFLKDNEDDYPLFETDKSKINKQSSGIFFKRK